MIEGDAQHADAVVRALVSGPLVWQVEVAHSIAQAQAPFRTAPPTVRRRAGGACAERRQCLRRTGGPVRPARDHRCCRWAGRAAAHAMRRGFGDFRCCATPSRNTCATSRRKSRWDLLVRTAAERARREVETELNAPAPCWPKNPELESPWPACAGRDQSRCTRAHPRVFNQRDAGAAGTGARASAARPSARVKMW